MLGTLKPLPRQLSFLLALSFPVYPSFPEVFRGPPYVSPHFTNCPPQALSENSDLLHLRSCSRLILKS